MNSEIDGESYAEYEISSLNRKNSKKNKLFRFSFKINIPTIFCILIFIGFSLFFMKLIWIGNWSE